MSVGDYTRCAYIPDGGQQCDNWFKRQTDNRAMEFCPLHEGMISPTLAAKDVNKQTYIEIRNAEVTLCASMTFEELDAHIAELERVIEVEKAKLYSSRGVRADKLDKLSEEEREVRRKIRVEKQEEAKLPKKPTIKNDPIKFFMATFNITEEEAKRKLGLI